MVWTSSSPRVAHSGRHRAGLQSERPAPQPDDRRHDDAPVADTGCGNPETGQRIAYQDSGGSRPRRSIPTGDLPPGIPITVGRERVDESLAIINDFRASVGQAPIDRSHLKLDPYRSLDARIAKSIRLRGSHRLELVIEGFNLSNHVNFRTDAVANMNASSFLLRTSARDGRQIQWGGRYRF